MNEILGEVEIPFSGVRWNIIPIAKEVEDGIDVELQWGWTAGMTPDDLKNYAEDAPTGHESVTTTLDLVEELRDKLNIIIETHKEKHLQLQAENIRKMKEQFPELDEMLARLATNLPLPLQ